MSKYVNISFPLKNSYKGYFFDDDESTNNSIKSNLLHLLLTEKGERIYQPRFGTNLKKFIFEPNDNFTQNDIVVSINESVRQFLPSVTITNIIFTKEGTKRLRVEIKYSIDEGILQRNDELILQFGEEGE